MIRKNIRWGLLLVAMTAACGGSSSVPTSPTPTPTSSTPTTSADTTTITITSSGVSPRAITVAVGSRVTMVNNDSRPHDMESDPHPVHTDCPAINWGPVQPGQAVQSRVLDTARTCGYHDHNLPDDSSLRGTIVIQ